MSCGVPAIVSDIGSFSEIPDDCVLKTSPQIVIDEYKSILIKAKSDRDWINNIGNNAYFYIKKNHNPDRIFQLTDALIEKRITLMQSSI
jgi:glycosyltransferase involved in cell wall biosynthesis